MKKVLVALFLSTFLLSGCGTKDSSNSRSTENNQPNRNTSYEKQIENKDVSGIYTDKQGTPSVYSELSLALQPDGTYATEIGVYRVGELKGTAIQEGDVLHFTSKDPYPYALADISITKGKAKVVIKTDAAGFKGGDTYFFPDGAPDKSTTRQAYNPSLCDEIATEISNAEKQEKEVEKRQKQAVTQLEMNQTALELYKLWDDTLNTIWKLLKANLSETDMKVLQKEERKWIAFKDKEVQAAGKESEGGSIQPLLEAMRGAELTKARVYELAKYAKQR